VTVTGFADPRPLIAGVFARIVAPPEPLVPSEWMAGHLVVPDGPRAGGRWDPRLTPYVAEIVDSLGPDSPHNLAAVRKSAQTGISVAGIGLVASYIDRAPARIGYALPTIDLLQEFNREKLTPTIEQTPALDARIKAQTSRSATGSTTVSKKFPGGSLVLLNANSAADLRSKTLKIGVGDEVDQWEDDLEGQGDPWDLLLGRFIAFHATGDWRLLGLSTPTLHNASRIDALFKAGDQRYWHVKCPQCSTEIVFEFKHLQYRPKPPYRAEYIAQCCGFPIEHHMKARLVREGRFVARNPEGLYPSFHVDALISQLTTWDKAAEAFLGAEGNERKLKAFYNLWLGLPYEVRGDAPDHVRLMERRESYPEKKIPPLGLLLTCGADVQHSGIWVHIDAWAPDAQSWVVWREFLEGDTTDPNLGAFLKLQSLYDERFEDAFGNKRLLDALAIDAGDGGRANQVYAFCRGRSRAYAVKGMPGWSRPALGTPTKVSITLKGKKLKGGVSLWPVGTWDLKAEFYADLRKEGRRAGQEVDPPGYVHFGEFLDEPYFRQITSETLADSKVRGRIVKIWKELGPNHLLDARVYSHALAEHLGLTRKTKDDWLQLAKRYSLPTEVGDLFASEALATERPAAAPKDVAEDFARTIAGKKSTPSPNPPRFARLGRGVRKLS
jgi:phage terminase large subunit GpA-like protein